MAGSSRIPRYNRRILHMRAQASSGLRLGWLTSFILASAILPPYLSASEFADTARQLAHKIAAFSGPGAVSLEITNRSSLDAKAVREVRSALEAALQSEGVHPAKPEQAMGSVEVILSESLRQFVWAAEITLGSDDKKVALVSMPRPPTEAASTAQLPIALNTTLLFGQQQPILDATLVEMPRASRLIVLSQGSVAIYHQQGGGAAGHWEIETSFPIVHSRAFPRDLRGRVFLRRDHLFDIYLPGILCRTSAISAAPLALTCHESDAAWPLAADDGSIGAFFAASRNFFTGALSPGIGKLSNAPPFYSAAALPRSSYTLWALAAVDGSLHLADGMTDQVIRGARWGSDIASVRSSCGTGTQLLVSENGDAQRDRLRAFEVPDRDPVSVSPAAEFDGRIVALAQENGGGGATAIVRRADTGWYEAYRVSISCSH